MQKILGLLTTGVCATACLGQPASAAQAPPEVTLTRMECGSPPPPAEVGLMFTDTFDYPGVKIQLVFSCYLIKHGNEYLLWDTGQSLKAKDVAPKVSLVDMLAQLKLKPEQIKYVGISHYHGDHTGQVDSFPKSTLLIGKGDWDAIASSVPNPAVDRAPFTAWISGGSKVEAVPTDKDVFGDGTVIMLNTPGHTPGHHSLLVRLKTKGDVLISGDLVHFHENYTGNGVPLFNTDRADTLASIDRFRKIAANRKATVIIQHDQRDVGLLPAFPASAN